MTIKQETGGNDKADPPSLRVHIDVAADPVDGAAAVGAVDDAAPVIVGLYYLTTAVGSLGYSG